MKVELKSLTIIRGESGGFFILGNDDEGREYMLPQVLTAEQATNVFVRIEEAARVIESLRWNCRAPCGSLAWFNDGMEERTIEDERMGMLGGW